MNKTGIMVAMLFWVVIAVDFIKQDMTAKDTVVTAFSEENFVSTDTIIEAFGEYSDSYMDEESKKEALCQIAASIGLENDYDVETDKESMILTKNGDNARTVISLLTSVKDYGTYKSARQYLTVNLTIYQRTDCALAYKNMLEDIFEANSIDGYVNINLKGMMAGALNYYERNRLADSLLKSLDASIVTENRDNELFTIYAYTEKIDEYIVSMGKKVNINISEEYDEKNNMTVICLATPLNNLDY